MALVVTAALTFTPVMGERWIPAEYVDAIRKEAHHRNPSGSDVATPPPVQTPLVELVAAYFQPEDVAAALRVIDCESGFLLTADNPRSTAWGPWQFLRSTWNWVATKTGSPLYDTGAPTDPVWSTINAAWLWYNVGPSQWVCW